MNNTTCTVQSAGKGNLFMAGIQKQLNAGKKNRLKCTIMVRMHFAILPRPKFHTGDWLREVSGRGLMVKTWASGSLERIHLVAGRTSSTRSYSLNVLEGCSRTYPGLIRHQNLQPIFKT